jgi:hypothetical protein
MIGQFDICGDAPASELGPALLRWSTYRTVRTSYYLYTPSGWALRNSIPQSGHSHNTAVLGPSRDKAARQGGDEAEGPTAQYN